MSTEATPRPPRPPSTDLSEGAEIAITSYARSLPSTPPPTPAPGPVRVMTRTQPYVARRMVDPRMETDVDVDAAAGERR